MCSSTRASASATQATTGFASTVASTARNSVRARRSRVLEILDGPLELRGAILAEQRVHVDRGEPRREQGPRAIHAPEELAGPRRHAACQVGAGERDELVDGLREPRGLAEQRRLEAPGQLSSARCSSRTRPARSACGRPSPIERNGDRRLHSTATSGADRHARAARSRCRSAVNSTIGGPRGTRVAVGRLAHGHTDDARRAIRITARPSLKRSAWRRSIALSRASKNAVVNSRISSSLPRYERSVRGSSLHERSCPSPR